MESRTRKRSSLNNNEDKISTLPNVLLHHILSFLDAVQVVQTCVLSKRWMNVWKSHPYLDFNFETFSSLISSYYYDDDMNNFTDFISHVLLRRNNIDVFKLSLDTRRDCQYSVVESLIYYAVKHHVEEISINTVHWDVPIVLPRCFFDCESLRSLKLKVDGGLALPKSLGLQSLKTLHLGGAQNFDGKIFSSCPNLENLTIEDICLNVIENFNIHALSLKSLEILNWRYNRIKQGCKVMLVAPKLTSFKFDGNTPLFWSEVNLTSLDDVNVVLQRYYYNHYYPFYVVEDEYISEEEETEQGLGLNLIKMLHQFCSAKSLTLSMNIIEVLSKIPAALNKHPSPFSNLKYLKLKTDHKDVTFPAHVLNYFLRSSSLLKVCF
ncbi:PREDICTED: F-box/LRR-repeat protein At3g26922-like [Populus euphratica]|uniref:F-box/LRR-repeat protein At3g26922-like n=1 Tax=Populus euphratica TaxID=75702 RepID=A0AAJ6Y760_POPEU|nr:PREDICTED: F-box/LRR-repeat protein At3g26922-like [Populus euphratica]XP_011044574.1 PREDICTED: F-box/LRR-repeat protein At3g26922-like [Populus euphratica]